MMKKIYTTGSIFLSGERNIWVQTSTPWERIGLLSVVATLFLAGSVYTARMVAGSTSAEKKKDFYLNGDRGRNHEQD